MALMFTLAMTDGGSTCVLGDAGALVSQMKHLIVAPSETPFSNLEALAWQVPETECAQAALAPYLEHLASRCQRAQCESLSGLVFRPYLRELLEAAPADGGAAMASAPTETRRATLAAHFSGSAFSLVDRWFIAISPVDAGVVRITAGTLDDTGLTIVRDEVRANRAADILRRRDAVSAPILGDGGDLPTSFGGVSAHEREWLARDPLPANGAFAACTDGTLRPLGPFVGMRARWQDFPSGWVRGAAYRLPCQAQWVIPIGPETRVKTWRAFTIERLPRPPGNPDFDIDGPFITGRRSRHFGTVTYVEHLTDASAQLPIYRQYCTIEATVNGAPVSTRIESGYGCHLEYAADFNGDGLSDFVVHTGAESCEFNVLSTSSPDGWHEVGRQGSCE